MTEHDNELKDLFRRKNMEEAFSPDEQNWKKMSSVLKNERKNERRLLVYFSLLLLSLGLGGAWLFVDQDKNSSDALTLTQPQSEKNTRAPIAKELQPEQDKAISRSVLEKQALKQYPVKRIALPTRKARAPIVKVQTAEPAQTKLESIGKEQQIPEHDQVTMQTQTAETDRTSDPEKETGLLISKSPVYEKVPVKGSSDQEPARQPETKGSDPDKDAPKTSTTEGNANEKLPVTMTEFEAKESVGDQNRSDLIISENASQKDSVPFSPGLAANHLPDTLITMALKKEADQAPEQKQDSAMAAVVPAKDSLLSMPSQGIFLEAGSNYLLGWKTNNKTEANGFNPLIGLQYYHHVSTRIGLSIGIQYSSINHLGITSHTSTTTRLKFGEETDVTVISALNMHYLLMPLKLSYGFNRNNFMCIGYTVGYLLDAESRVENYSTRLDYSSTPVVSRSMGYTSGFNPYDGQITVCYRRCLFKEWYVNGEFFYGLLDIKNNVKYSSDAFERICGFKLSLGINLWKK